VAGFRATLDAWLAGRADAVAVEHALAAELVADPRLAASSRALIDAYQRTGHIPVPLANRLAAVVANPAQFQPPPAPLPPPAAEPPAERTVFRLKPSAAAPRDASAPPPPAQATEPPAEPPPDRTVLRAKPSAPKPPAEAPGERTILRPPKPPAEPPPAPTAHEAVEQVPEAKTQFRIKSHVPAPVPDVTGATGGRTGGPTDRSHPTGATHGTASLSWNPTSGFAGATAAQLKIGDVLNGRYVLEGLVPGGDKGGMGVVFKARDLINEEAEDRNPFVAIKVLNEEFKRHPDSMRALFNEVKNATKLAHPNIITVFNFNRDGGNVYMVMELLEGQPLDEVLRGVKDRGLPLAEAMGIIQSLSRALAYAHQRNVVHADFKPSNAFITKEGFVKVLDFGIARAAGQVYDPGTLGAFTPLTASPEQIEGKNPEASDDVYALAIVSYQLITGRHPFYRKETGTEKAVTYDAVKARDRGLKPARIASLSRVQWRTLHNALSFTRESRPPNAQAFLDGMTRKRIPLALAASLGVAAILLVLAAALVLPDLIANRRAQSVLDDLNSGNPALVEQGLRTLEGFDGKMRKRMLALDEHASDAVNMAYERGVDTEFNVAAKRYHYPAARKIVQRAENLFPDSRGISELSSRLDNAYNQVKSEQADQFEQLLKSRKLLSDAGEPSLLGVIGVIRELNPSDPALTDPRIAVAFHDRANDALNAGRLPEAERFVTEGTKLAPNDPNMRDLSDRLARARHESAMASQVSELERAVQPLTEPSATLEDFRKNRTALAQLSSAKPGDAVLTRAVRRLEALVGIEVPKKLAAGDEQGALVAVDEFQALISAEFLATQQKAVEKVMGAAQARIAEAEQLRTRIKALLTTPLPTDEWVKDLQAQLQLLRAIAPADAQIAAAQQAASGFLLNKERELLKTKQFSEAERLIGQARSLGAAESVLNEETEAIKRGRADLAALNQQNQQQAELDRAKQRVLDYARAGGGRLDEAHRLYTDLQSKLSAGDAWGAEEAPDALADGYLRSAQKFLLAGDFGVALKQAQVISSLPGEAAKHAADLQLYQGYAAVAETLRTGSLDSASTAVADLKRRDGGVYDRVEPRLIALITSRIASLIATDGAQADALATAAKKIFPQAHFPVAAAAPVTRPQPPPPAAAPPVAAPPVVVPVTPVQSAPSAAPVAPPIAAPHTPATAAERPCTKQLANEGGSGRKQGRCTDVVAGSDGPELVVISAGGAVFAMMRDEVSYGDWAVYCAATSCAKPAPASKAPVTSVSLAQAEQYAQWLSSQSGAHYRLPTDAEWTAAVGTNVDRDSVNCAFGSRGLSVRDVGSGAGNQFGLRDILGNAREWVRGPGGAVLARGGSFGQPLQECMTNPSEPHSGKPDGRTGFRFIREMN
jgi:serine/threonine protein kinase